MASPQSKAEKTKLKGGSLWMLRYHFPEKIYNSEELENRSITILIEFVEVGKCENWFFKTKTFHDFSKSTDNLEFELLTNLFNC